MEPGHHPRMADIEAAVAVGCGIPARDVAMFARRLREMDLLTRETRSRRSWRSNPTDAARIVAALMTGVGPIRAPDAVVRMEGMILAKPHKIRVRELDLPGTLQADLLRTPATFVGAISALIAHVAHGHGIDRGGLIEGTAAEHHPNEHFGCIYLRWHSPSIPGPAEGRLIELHYQSPTWGCRDVGLSSIYRLSLGAICQIASVFRG